MSDSHPALEKFSANLRKAMADKRMSGSDVARAVWGSKTDGRGQSVARNRDRITHYLRGNGYPRPETVVKLAEVLGLDPKDLEREPGKVNGTRPPIMALPGAADEACLELVYRDIGGGRASLTYRNILPRHVALRLFDAIRAVDPDFNKN